MPEILKSASKIVFVCLAVTSCAAYLLGKLPTDQFMILVMAAFTFYFSNKGETNGDKPFAGK